MNRSIRQLALAAACAVLAVGGLAAATPAASASTSDYPTANWGPYYSPYAGGGRAKTSGRVWPDPDNGSFHFQARVYDQNPSTRMCGYIQVKYVNTEGIQPTPSSAKKCGTNSYGRVDFSDWEEDVPETYLIQVCQWDSKLGVKRYCGTWKYAFRFPAQG
ncbi:hypothetical protein [Nonomuraea sp. NPDC049784]|uniref:hypothetical protein n=1 Tax=Nonomuraea sp. NPDC049784 TaxID=3154361 RepID=UPI0033D05BD0